MVPTSRSRAPVEAIRSGSRKPAPISISSPRLTTTSPPAASAVVASTSAAAPLLTTSASSAAGQASQQCFAERRRRASSGCRWRGRVPRRRSRSRRSVRRPRPAASGARPRLVCTTTPVALSTGRNFVVVCAASAASTRVLHLIGRQIAAPGPVLDVAHHGSHDWSPSRFRARCTGRERKQLICARNQAARVDLGHVPLGLLGAGGGGRESNPPDRDTRSHRF